MIDVVLSLTKPRVLFLLLTLDNGGNAMFSGAGVLSTLSIGSDISAQTTPLSVLYSWFVDWHRTEDALYLTLHALSSVWFGGR